MDPFLDIIRLLRPRATIWVRIDASSPWGVSFRQRNDVLFCWVKQGECLLTRPSVAPLRLGTDDFALIRTATPFALASDPDVKPQDSEIAFAAARNRRLKLGDGDDAPSSLRGGRFVFDTANEKLLMDLLPALVHVSAGDAASSRVRSLLRMSESETLKPGPGSEFITLRLTELILVEILRSQTAWAGAQHSGLLAGLGDPVTACALSAMHGDPAHEWTVSKLARHCAVSRSTFAALFRKVVGSGPIEYLANWRLALAKDELRYGTRSIHEIALFIGFQSSSAFSTAFTKAVGCSPGRFADSALSASASLEQV